MGKRKKMSKLNMTGGSPVAELSRSISAPTDRFSRGISRLVWLVYKLAGVSGVARGIKKIIKKTIFERKN